MAGLLELLRLVLRPILKLVLDSLRAKRQAQGHFADRDQELSDRLLKEKNDFEGVDFDKLNR